jgi:hypothetical protein
MKSDKRTPPSEKQSRILTLLGYTGPIPKIEDAWMFYCPTVHDATCLINKLLVERGLGGRVRGKRAPWRQQN